MGVSIPHRRELPYYCITCHFFLVLLHGSDSASLAVSYNFSHHQMTNCAASPQAAIVELANFAELPKLTEKFELMEKFTSPSQPPFIH